MGSAGELFLRGLWPSDLLPGWHHWRWMDRLLCLRCKGMYNVRTDC